MTSALLNIVVKELREIFRDPRLFLAMILVPVLIFPIMGSAVQTSVEASEQEMARMEVGLWNIDGDDGNGTLGDVFFDVMQERAVNSRNITASSLEEAVEFCIKKDLGTLIVIPMNFTEVITSRGQTRIDVHQVLTHYGFAELHGPRRSQEVLSHFNARIREYYLSDAFPGIDPYNITWAANYNSHSIIQGEVVDVDPEMVVQTVTGTGMMMPMIIMIMVMMTAQLAATSVAMEKEQKTLEVLLTVPIKRINFLVGKLTGVICVSILASVSYLLGFTYYMQSFQVAELNSVDLGTVGVAPDATGAVLMLVTLFLSFIAALSLAVLLSAYTKDVRSAQSLVSMMIIPIVIPAIVLMMSPVELLPTGMQAFIYGIPFSYPIIASKAMYTHQYTTVIFGTLYLVTFTVLMLMLAARMFATEKVLVASFDIRKKKKPVE